MFSDTFNFFLAGASSIIGILLLTGNGAIFMRGGNAKERSKIYDEKKMEKGSGIALIAIGIATGVDTYTTGVAAKIGYVIFLVIVFVGLILFYKKKCRK